MKEIFSDIYQMNLALPGFSPDSMNVYLFRTREGYSIIDTGWETALLVRSVEEQLAEFGIEFSDIKQVLITHCHVDHLGMMRRYQQLNQAKVSIHRNETGLIKTRFSQGDSYWPMTEKFLQTHGMPQSELSSPKFELPRLRSMPEPDILLEDGDIIPVGKYRLRVINTPGHTPGHVSYYEPEKRLLFAGDVLLPTIATNAALHVQHIINPMQQHLQSLLRLKELEIEMVLPGHEYIFSNHRCRIDELIQHYREKAVETEKAFSDSLPMTAYDVSRVISWSPDRKTTSWSKFSDWDKRFAVLQTIANLEEMVYSKKLVRFSRDGKLYYQKPS